MKRIIKWQGQSEDRLTIWTAEADSYAGLYKELVEKGIISTVDGDPYEVALMKKNDKAESDFVDEDGGFEWDAYQAWSEKGADIKDLTDDEFKSLIKSQTQYAVYQEFEEVEM